MVGVPFLLLGGLGGVDCGRVWECVVLPFSFGWCVCGIGLKLSEWIVGVPMGTNCAPLVAYLSLFCYERDFMLSLSDNNQTDINEAFNSTSRYLDDLLNIDYPYFEQMVGQMYPTELQLNKIILLILKFLIWT